MIPIQHPTGSFSAKSKITGLIALNNWSALKSQLGQTFKAFLVQLSITDRRGQASLADLVFLS